MPLKKPIKGLFRAVKGLELGEASLLVARRFESAIRKTLLRV